MVKSSKQSVKNGDQSVTQDVLRNDQTPVSPGNSRDTTPSTAGVIVLQWLTYAFWGWLIVALIWLVGIVLADALLNESVDDIVPYSLAATIVLLPIAFLTDFFYRRHEPVKKTGAATVIMVIHAVIFALLGIGALIGAVFMALAMMLRDGDIHEGQIVTLITLLFAVVLYVFAFLRTINPFNSKKVAFFYGIGMLVISAAAILFGIFGPIVTSIQLRDDRRIERHLSSVQDVVDDYIQTNKKLPENLNTLDYDGEEQAQALVDDNLVTYKKINEGKVLESDDFSSLYNKQNVFRYQLCVEYKKASPEYTQSYSYRERSSDDEYTSRVLTSRHPEGGICYKLQETVYNMDFNRDTER